MKSWNLNNFRKYRNLVKSKKDVIANTMKKYSVQKLQLNLSDLVN